jgi:hypothetical protein
MFRSCKYGIFSDVWKLTTHPALPVEQQITVNLKGYVIEKDVHKEKRESIDKVIHKKLYANFNPSAVAIAQETVQRILRRVEKLHPSLEINRNLRMLDFEMNNKNLDIDFNDILLAKLSKFAKKLINHLQLNQEWDLKINSLYQVFELNKVNLEPRFLESK